MPSSQDGCFLPTWSSSKARDTIALPKDKDNTVKQGQGWGKLTLTVNLPVCFILSTPASGHLDNALSICACFKHIFSYLHWKNFQRMFWYLFPAHHSAAITKALPLLPLAILLFTLGGAPYTSQINTHGDDLLLMKSQP